MFKGALGLSSNNLELVLGIALRLYRSVEKELKLKVRKFLGLIPTFEAVARKKLEGGPLWPTIPNRFKYMVKINIQITQTIIIYYY